jgi:hypothetical protein
VRSVIPAKDVTAIEKAAGHWRTAAFRVRKLNVYRMYPAPVLRAATNHNQARESEQYCSHSKNKARALLEPGAIVSASPVSWRGVGGAMVAGELAGTHDCNHSNTTPIRRSLRQTTRHGNVRPSLGKTSVNFSGDANRAGNV